ncbi:MAG: hypothetical protein V4628_00995 [Pseudomonadota bacterium]
MTHSRYSSVLLLSAALFLPVHLFAQSVTNLSNELLYGTWVLDLQRSVFIEREAPKSQSMIFEPDADGLRVTIIITNKNNIEEKISYIDKQNGEPARLSGSTNFDTIVLESRDPYHTASIFTHAGMEVGRSQRTISLNGQEMMVEVERKGNLSSRSVFLKQK